MEDFAQTAASATAEDYTSYAFAILIGYFVPTAIAILRRHANQVPIFLVNLIFGLSGIVWIVALIWAFSSNVKPKKQKPAEA